MQNTDGYTQSVLDKTNAVLVQAGKKCLGTRILYEAYFVDTGNTVSFDSQSELTDFLFNQAYRASQDEAARRKGAKDWNETMNRDEVLEEQRYILRQAGFWERDLP